MKTNKLKDINGNFYIVIDFDQTITSKESENSWSAIIDSKYIKKEHSAENKKLYQKYKPIEINESLDLQYRIEKMNEWYSLILKLFYKYENDKDVIGKAVKNAKLKLRDGAISFFNKLHTKNIPVIIVSAGIENTIEEFLKLNNIYYNNTYIVSNRIDFDNKNSDTYVHALNKDKQVWNEEIIGNIDTKEYAILIGDVIADINMLPVSINNKKITIAFLDNNIEENLELYNKYFDIVLTRDTSFNEVERILGI